MFSLMIVVRQRLLESGLSEYDSISGRRKNEKLTFYYQS